MFDSTPSMKPRCKRIFAVAALMAVALIAGSCSRSAASEPSVKGEQSSNTGSAVEPTVGVVQAGVHELSQQLTLSSELVPFQEIDVYAKRRDM